MPRAFENGDRINLPRPPASGRPQQYARPMVSPTGSPDIRARRGELQRPALPQPPPGPPGREIIPQQPPGAPSQTRPVEPPAFGQPPMGEDRMAPPGADRLQQQQQAQQLDQMRPQDQVPQPPKRSSPLGDNSPIEQASRMAGPETPAGADAHLRKIGLPDTPLPGPQQKLYEARAVKDYKRFGDYSGQDDPDAPPPPIRPGKHSFNPTTGQWVLPEGQVSVLDRFMKGAGNGRP